MAKTITQGTITPFVFSPNKPVLAEHQRAVVEQQNFAVGRRPIVFMNTNGRMRHSPFTTATGLGADGVQGNSAYFPSPIATWVTVYRLRIRVPVEVQVLQCSVRCYFEATTDGDVRFTIGGGSLTLNVTNAGNGTRVSNTITTATTGTGALDVTVELRSNVLPLGLSNTLTSCRIQSAVIAAADLPDPANS